MNVLLCGTRTFGAHALRALTPKVVAVVAPPGDRTATEAEKLGLPVHRDVTESLVRDLRVDLIVGAHTHAYIGRRSRAAATYGALGYHPSLLPRHRGKDAVRWTIKMGDPIAGGSVYWYTDNVDCGPVAAQAWCHVLPGWDHHDLWREALFPIGVELLERVVGDVAAGRIVQVDQDERAASWEPTWERPPVHRPELIELGDGQERIRVIKETTWAGDPVRC